MGVAVNHTGQEEYIWAMRASLYRESDVELWKDRKRHDNSRSAVNVASRTKSLLETTTYQTKIMASLVPDEVIHNVEDYSHRQYEACFLFGDVSGRDQFCMTVIIYFAPKDLPSYAKNTPRLEFRVLRE